MINNYQTVKNASGIFRFLPYVVPNAYYPNSVSHLVLNIDEINFTGAKGPLADFLNETAYIRLKSCFYNPDQENTATLSDLVNKIQVNTQFIEEPLTQRTHISDVLLAYKKEKDLPILVNYKPTF